MKDKNHPVEKLPTKKKAASIEHRSSLLLANSKRYYGFTWIFPPSIGFSVKKIIEQSSDANGGNAVIKVI